MINIYMSQELYVHWSAPSVCLVVEVRVSRSDLRQLMKIKPREQLLSVLLSAPDSHGL